jgi:hypothetical protein
MKKQFAFFSVFMALVLMIGLAFQITSASAIGGGIVINGSFEAGNSGFTSSYGYVAPAFNVLYPEGLYTVTTDPLIVHDGFGPSRGDHTTGTGLMFIANGGPLTTDIVWQGEISQDLIVGDTYDFSAWVMNADGGANALLTFKAGGVTIGTIEVTSKSWQRIYGSFVADAIRPALYLTNAQANPTGNDFAIDDISIYAHGTHTPPSTGTTASTTVVGTSGSPSASGTLVTFTATVTPAGATGSVDFYEGDTYLGTGAVDGSGIATYATSGLALGDHTIQAEYSGDSTYKVSYGTVAQSVIPCFTPVVSSVDVIAGPIAGGTAVSITGDHFNDAGCTVTSAAFGGTAGTSFAVVDTNHINVTTPAHALGTYDVTVTGVGGTGTLTGTLLGGFTFVPPPTVEFGHFGNGVTPRLGPLSGRSVTVTGTYLTGLGTGNATFTFGGTGAICTVIDAGSATCTTPHGYDTDAAFPLDGHVSVVATTPYGGTGTVVGDFYYVAITPQVGPVSGNQAVTITGVGYLVAPGATRRSISFDIIGHYPSSCLFTDTLATCRTPTHTAGLVDVLITFPDINDGTVSLLDDDGYTYVATPSFDCCGGGIYPNIGSDLGGTEVTLYGHNLTGGTFYFGGIPTVTACTFNSDGTEAYCTTPAHTAGVVSVTVVTDGGTATLRNCYTYNASPVITEADPANVTMSEDNAPTPFALTLHATDPEGDSLTWSKLTDPNFGTASINATTGVVKYSPPKNYYGPDTFNIQVADSFGGTDTITVLVNVTPVNDIKIEASSFWIIYNNWRNRKDAAGGYMGDAYISSQGGQFTMAIPKGATKITFTSYRGPDQGNMEFLVDGVSVKNVSLYSATVVKNYLVVVNIPAGGKKLTVVALGTKNAASTDTWVRLDAYQFSNGKKIDADLDLALWNRINEAAGADNYDRQTNRVGSIFETTIIGQRLIWETYRGPDAGTVEVYKDGVLIQTIDLYNATAIWHQMYTFGPYPYGTYNFKFVVVAKNPLSSNSIVIVDSLDNE